MFRLAKPAICSERRKNGPFLAEIRQFRAWNTASVDLIREQATGRSTGEFSESGIRVLGLAFPAKERISGLGFQNVS